jgi:hypothetical protein
MKNRFFYIILKLEKNGLKGLVSNNRLEIDGNWSDKKVRIWSNWNNNYENIAKEAGKLGENVYVYKIFRKACPVDLDIKSITGDLSKKKIKQILKNDFFKAGYKSDIFEKLNVEFKLNGNFEIRG